MKNERCLLLVGPGKHFGLEVAERFASEGFSIGLVSRTGSALTALASNLQARGFTSTIATADVTAPHEVRAAIKQIISALGPPSCVIYNVKSSVPGTALEMNPADLTRAFDVNVGGALAVIQAVAQDEIAARGITIILTGGGYKDKPEPTRLALSISKAAVHSLYLSLAMPFQRRGMVLKSVIIDGVVRREGPLLPDDVANCFWAAYRAPRRREFWVPSREGSDAGKKQARLFS